MPGMSGLDLLRHLAARGTRIPVIVLTAYGADKTRRRWLDAGAVAFLEKPFQSAALLDAVRTALSSARWPGAAQRGWRDGSSVDSILDDPIRYLRGGDLWVPTIVPCGLLGALSAGTVTSALSSTASTRSTGCFARSSKTALTVGKKLFISSTPSYGKNI